MPARVRVFLDTSALFAAIWSAAGGGREMVRLGEAELLQVLVCSPVLRELEGALRRKAPAALGSLALLLDRVGVEVVPEPYTEAVARSEALTGHPGDATVLAGAWQAATDYFVTLDREHFLENPKLTGALSFLIGTPGDFLEWYRRHLQRGR